MAHLHPLLFVLAAIMFIQLSWLCWLFLPCLRKKIKKPRLSAKKAFTLLIYAKNQEQNLRELLELVKDLPYPTYEILVIDHDSTDYTEDVTDDFATQITRCFVANNEHFWANKKYALTLGIKKAKYDYIIPLSASDRPIRKTFLEEINDRLKEKTMFLIGTNFQKDKLRLSRWFAQWVEIFQSAISFGLSQCKAPQAHGNQLLCFHKEAFFAINGFVSHIHEPSKAFAKLVDENGSKENTVLCLKPLLTNNGHQESGMHKIHSFYSQANRHHWQHLLAMKGFTMSWWLLLIITAWSIISSHDFIDVLLCWGVFVCIQTILFGAALYRFDQTKLGWASAFLFPVYVAIRTYIGVEHLFLKLISVDQ